MAGGGKPTIYGKKNLTRKRHPDIKKKHKTGGRGKSREKGGKTGGGSTPKNGTDQAGESISNTV